jgi:hypothetical protein
VLKMNAMCIGVAAFSVVATTAANAELVVYTAPAGEPYAWVPWNQSVPLPQQNPAPQSFNPSLPPTQNGTDIIGFHQAYTVSSSSTGPGYQFYYHHEGDSLVAYENIQQSGALIFQTYELSFASFSKAIEFKPGDLVGPNVGYSGVTFSWCQGPNGTFDKRYKLSTGTPGVFVQHELPDRQTIGIRFLIAGVHHYGWADIEWLEPGTSPPSRGRYRVLRWGYETQPGVPALVTAAPPPGCAVDANEDGATNAADLSVLLAQFGASVAAGTVADFNGDGLVNGADLSVLLGAFGCE